MVALLINTPLHAATPVWTFNPLTKTQVSVSVTGTATVQYTVTNQSYKSHTLFMKPIQGIHASGCAAPLAAHQSCTLTLTISGSKLHGNVSGGPILCEQGNPNQCYQPSQGNGLVIQRTQQLEASISDLALSVTGRTEFGIGSLAQESGVSRIITISNKSGEDAFNFQVTSTGLPSDTTTTGGTCDGLTTLPHGSSCTIQINPGIITSSDSSDASCDQGTEPVAGTVQASSTNVSPVSTNVLVLDYGCVSQGGLVFAFDDTTPDTTSVGGKVVVIPVYHDLKVWGPLEAVGSGAQSFTNGATNTEAIVAKYPDNSNDYPANVCSKYAISYEDWYLPAICEMTYGSGDCGTSTSPALQNIYSSLVASGVVAGAPSGRYWSSTESASFPDSHAWAHFFDLNTFSTTEELKDSYIQIFCVRGF